MFVYILRSKLTLYYIKNVSTHVYNLTSFTLYKIPGMSIGDHSNEIQGCSELFFQVWRHMTDFPKTEIQ